MHILESQKRGLDGIPRIPLVVYGEYVSMPSGPLLTVAASLF